VRAQLRFANEVSHSSRTPQTSGTVNEFSQRQRLRAGGERRKRRVGQTSYRGTDGLTRGCGPCLH
jgi:hypothetical protein